jgi:poly-gamma-glutamate synthesis protein (capsule biosynthesis protein)
MSSPPLTESDRAARRAVRRRQIRRRRLTLALAVGLAVALAVLLGARAAADGRASEAAQTPPSPTTASPTAQPASAPVASARGRLGSGKSVTFAFAGDIHFESPIRERLARSPASILAPIAPVVANADLAVANLETAVTERGSPAAKEYTFRAPSRAFAALRDGGIDVVSVANNHGMDFGATGLRDTLAAGRRARVPIVGGGRNDREAYAPYRRTIRGQRIAVIGATQVLDDHLVSAWTAGPGRAGLASAKDEPRLLRAVREARETSDTLIVFLHWGVELESCPTADQRRLANALVAAGADIVVGSHAHVLAGGGRLGEALVAYGLGNFVFYAFRESTVQSGVLEVTATGRRIDHYRWRPARISSGIPYPLSGRERARALSGWNRLRACTNLRR